MTEPKILLALAQQLSHDTFCAGRKTNPKKIYALYEPSKGRRPRGHDNDDDDDFRE